MHSTGQLPAQAAAEFLASRIDYERSLSVPYNQRDLRLDRMRDLLHRLGNPQDRLRIVHVAGTKGKGSTAAMIAAVLTAGGFRTGLYSSPHLDGVEERLAIDGQSCPAEELVELIGRVRPAVEAMDALSTDGSDTRPTYFEIVTALALLRFAEQGVDAAVLEVGMGGRLDSTNVCQPLISVITTISFDHTQQLGNTLAAIAGEKAGIIKPGVPVVSGVIDHEPRDVIRKVADVQGCRLVELARDFDFMYHPPRALDAGPSDATLDVRVLTDPQGSAHYQSLQLPLVGRHQAANAAVALATIEELRRQGWPITDAAVREGLNRVRWPARIEVIARRPTIVLDAAHNVASVEALVEVLGESFAARRRVLVFATTRDKNLRGMLEWLVPSFDEIIFTRYHSNPRGVAPQELVDIARELDASRDYVMCDDARAAWEVARSRVDAQDLLCIAGSFFIAAEMRAAMEETSRPQH